MKKFTRIASLAAITFGALMLAGCTKDFSEDIDVLEKRVKTLEDDTAVELLTSRVSTLETLSKSFVTIAKEEADIAAVNTSITGINSTLGTLGTRIESVNTELTNFKTLAAATDTNYSKSIARINDVLKDYAKTSDVNKQVSNLTDAIAGVKALFANYTLASDYNALVDQFNDLKKVVDENKKDISTNASDIEALQSLLDGALASIRALGLEDTRLAGLISQEVAERKIVDKELQEAIDAAKQDLQNKIDDINDVQIPALKADIELCLKISDFETAKAALEKSIKDVDNAVVALKGVVATNKLLSEQADATLQGQIDLINEDLSGIHTTLVGMQADIDTRATKTELSSAVANLQSQINTIVNTTIPELKTVVENNYKDLDKRVKDIVSEIAQMWKTLETKEVVAALSTKVNALQVTVAQHWSSFTDFKVAQEALNSNYETSLKSHQEAIENLQSRVSTLESRVTALEAALKITNDNVATNASEIDKLQTAVAYINTVELVNIKAAIDARYTKTEIDGFLVNINGKISELAALLKTKADAKDVADKISDIEFAIKENEKSIGDLDGTYSGLISDLNDKILDIKSSLTGLSDGQLLAVNKAIADLTDSQFAELQRQVDALNDIDGGLDTRLRAIESKLSGTVGSVATNLTTLSGMISTLREDLENLSKRVDALEEKVDAVLERVAMISNVPSMGIELTRLCLGSLDTTFLQATFVVRPAAAAACLDTTNTSLYVKNGISKNYRSPETMAPTNIEDAIYPVKSVVLGDNGEVTVYAFVNTEEYGEKSYKNEIVSYYALEFEGQDSAKEEPYYVISDFTQASQDIDYIDLMNTDYAFLKDSVGLDGQEVFKVPFESVADSAVYSDTASRVFFNISDDYVAFKLEKGNRYMTFADLQTLLGLKISAGINSNSYTTKVQHTRYPNDRDPFGCFLNDSSVVAQILPASGNCIGFVRNFSVFVDYVFYGTQSFVVNDVPATASYKILPYVDTTSFVANLAQPAWEWKLDQWRADIFDTVIVDNQLMHDQVAKFMKEPKYVVFDSLSHKLTTGKEKKDSCWVYAPKESEIEVDFHTVLPLAIVDKDDKIDTVYTFSGLAGCTENNQTGFQNTILEYRDSVLYKFNYTYTLAARPIVNITLPDYVVDTLYLSKENHLIVDSDTLRGKDSHFGYIVKNLEKYYDYDNLSAIYQDSIKWEYEGAKIYQKKDSVVYAAEARVPFKTEVDWNTPIHWGFNHQGGAYDVWYAQHLASVNYYGTYTLIDTIRAFDVNHIITRNYVVNAPKAHKLVPISEYLGYPNTRNYYSAEIKGYVDGNNEYQLYEAHFEHYFKLSDTATVAFAQGTEVKAIGPMIGIKGAPYISYKDYLSLGYNKSAIQWEEMGSLQWNNYQDTEFDVAFVLQTKDGYNVLDSATVHFWTDDPLEDNITVNNPVVEQKPLLGQATEVNLFYHFDMFYQLPDSSRSSLVSTKHGDKAPKSKSCPNFGEKFKFEIAQSSANIAAEHGIHPSDRGIMLPKEHAKLLEDISIDVNVIMDYMFGQKTATIKVVFKSEN